MSFGITQRPIERTRSDEFNLINAAPSIGLRGDYDVGDRALAAHLWDEADQPSCKVAAEIKEKSRAVEVMGVFPRTGFQEKRRRVPVDHQFQLVADIFKAIVRAVLKISADPAQGRRHIITLVVEKRRDLLREREPKALAA